VHGSSEWLRVFCRLPSGKSSGIIWLICTTCCVLVNTSTFVKIFKHRRALIANTLFLLNVVLFHTRTTFPVGRGLVGGLNEVLNTWWQVFRQESNIMRRYNNVHDTRIIIILQYTCTLSYLNCSNWGWMCILKKNCMHTLPVKS